MNHKVVYLMSGEGHLPYLVASIHSLRKVWDGPVEVYAWPESYPLVQEIASHRQLRITAHEREKPNYNRRNRQFMDKIRLMQEVEADRVLYLDADTVVQGDIEQLFDVLNNGISFSATQFNDWVAVGRIVNKRISRLEGRDGIDQSHVRRVLNPANKFPSLNGGIFSACPNSPVLEKWFSLTYKVQDIFIADETVLHLLPSIFSPNDMHVHLGGAFNCSPKFQPPYLNDDDVKVWHFHGDSNLRWNKTPKGVWLWEPIFKEVLENNVGKINDWLPQIDYKYLNRYMDRVKNLSDDTCFYCDGLITTHTKKCPLYQEEVNA